MRFHEKKVSSVFFPGFSTPYAGRLQKKRDPEKRSKKKGTTPPGRCFVFFPHIFCRLLSELKSPPSSPRLLHSALPLAPARPCFPCLASDGLKNKTTAATAGSRIPPSPAPTDTLLVAHRAPDTINQQLTDPRTGRLHAGETRNTNVFESFVFPR